MSSFGLPLRAARRAWREVVDPDRCSRPAALFGSIRPRHLVQLDVPTSFQSRGVWRAAARVRCPVLASRRRSRGSLRRGALARWPRRGALAAFRRSGPVGPARSLARIVRCARGGSSGRFGRRYCRWAKISEGLPRVRWLRLHGLAAPGSVRGSPRRGGPHGSQGVPTAGGRAAS